MSALNSPVRRTSDDGGESSLHVHDWPHLHHIPWAGFPSPDPASDGNGADTDDLVSSRENYSLSLRSSTSFSPQRGQDNAAQDWAILMIDAEQTKYLFVKKLSEGNQSIVQICQRLDDNDNDSDTKQFVVRKRSREPITATRASRPDRECKIAQAIYRKRDEFLRRPGAQEQRQPPRFAELLSFANIPADNHENNSDKTNQGKFFRESFWTYCDGAGTLKDLLTLLAKNKQLPAALILHFIHKVLCAVQWLNGDTDDKNGMAIFHCDLNCNNIFLDWDDAGNLQPVIGDFGYSRLEPPHEPAWNDRKLFIHSFNDNESDIANLSSPPADYVAFQNPQDRMPLDFAHFAETLYRLLQVIIEPDVYNDLNENDEHEAPTNTQQQQQQYDAIFSLLEALLEKGREDRAGGNQPATTQRPPRPDISGEIARAAALLSQLQEDVEQQIKLALASWAQSVPSVNPSARNGRSLQPLLFATEEAAQIMAEAHKLGETGPYVVVNVRDAASVEAGVRLLVKMRQCGGGCDDDDEGPALEAGEWELPSPPSFSPPASCSLPSSLMGASAYSTDPRTGEGVPRPSSKDEQHNPTQILHLSDDSSEFITINSIAIPSSEGQDITDIEFFHTPPPQPFSSPIPATTIPSSSFFSPPIPPTTSFIPRTRGEDAARLFMEGRVDAEARVVRARAEAIRSFFSPSSSSSLPSLSPSPSPPGSSFVARSSSSTSYVRRLGVALQGRRDRWQQGEEEEVEGFDGEVQIQQIQQRIKRAEDLRKTGLLKSIRCKFV